MQWSTLCLVRLERFKPGYLLAICAVAAAILVIASMALTGHVAMWVILAVGFFNSIMFPTIFSLGEAELGPLSGTGSGLLNMAIVGGAIIPVMQGFIADHAGLHHAFVLPVICYLYILFYALKGSKPNSERYAPHDGTPHGFGRSCCTGLSIFETLDQLGVQHRAEIFMKVLVIDVGGTHVKELVSGEIEPRKFVSGPKLTAKQMVAGVTKITQDWKYDLISIGFPRPVLRGRPVTEPCNLGGGWGGFNFRRIWLPGQAC